MQNIEKALEELNLCRAVIAQNLKEVSQGMEPEAQRLIQWSNYSITFALGQVMSILKDIETYGVDIGEWPGFKPLMPSEANIPSKIN